MSPLSGGPLAAEAGLPSGQSPSTNRPPKCLNLQRRKPNPRMSSKPKVSQIQRFSIAPTKSMRNTRDHD